MKISITSQDGRGDFDFTVGGPWTSFKKSLESAGNQVVPISQEPEAIIFNNYNGSLFTKFSSFIPKERRFLISWEPPSNKPEMYRKEVLNSFGYRFFPSPIWASRFEGEYFDWPQGTKSSSDMFPWPSRLNKWCMIQGNRWSLCKGETYSLRRVCLTEFSKKIDLFGFDWNKGILRDLKSVLGSLISKGFSSPANINSVSGLGRRYSNYKGTVSNKLETLGLYKFSLVIENSSEYLSEKLIDVILAGAVPVYVGARLEEFRLPSDLALSANPKIEEIKSAMLRLESDEALCTKILDAGKSYLMSNRYQETVNDHVLKRLGERISEVLT